MLQQRTVFFISDGTGITAGALGQLLAHFPQTNFAQVRAPFTDSIDKIEEVKKRILIAKVADGMRPVVIMSLGNVEHRATVMSELKKALARDRTKISVSSFSALGLVEMTRKRTRESLAHILCEQCPACGGKGQVKTSRTICYEILRELLREAKQFNPREFRILASQEVVDLFLEEESQHLALLGDFIGKKISLQVETSFHQEQYDVILM